MWVTPCPLCLAWVPTACSKEGFAGVDWRGTATWMLFQQFPCTHHRIQNEHIANQWYKALMVRTLRKVCEDHTIFGMQFILLCLLYADCHIPLLKCNGLAGDYQGSTHERVQHPVVACPITVPKYRGWLLGHWCMWWAFKIISSTHLQTKLFATCLINMFRDTS